MDADLDTLCIAVYCTADDLLPSRPANARRRSPTPRWSPSASPRRSWASPRTGAFSPRPGASSGTCSPAAPARPATTSAGARLAETIEWLIGVFADQSPGLGDDLLLLDSTPVECGALGGDHPPLGPGRCGRLRLLPQPLALLLGDAPAPRLRPRRHPAGGQPGRRRPARARGGARAARPARLRGGETIVGDKGYAGRELRGRGRRRWARPGAPGRGATSPRRALRLAPIRQRIESVF